MKFILAFILYSGVLLSQTISFDEFIETSKGFLNQKALEQVKETYDEDCLITSADIGDISGDGKNDFAISIREKKAKDRIININIYCDSAGSYIKVFSDYLQFFELPIEIAFNISKQVCYVTQKLEEKKWKVSGYTFYKNELKVVDLYSTDILPINKRWNVGEENYSNYTDLISFVGYFDLHSIEQFKKNKYFLFPVYNKKRNLYKGYRREILLSNLWNWQDTVVSQVYGKVSFNRSEGNLILNLSFNNEIINKIGKSGKINIDLNFDRSAKRLNKNNNSFVNHLPLRNKLDENISKINIEVLPGNSNRTKIDINSGKNFTLEFQDGIDVNFEPAADQMMQIKLPNEYFNLPEGQTEIGAYVMIRFKLNDTNEIVLTSSNGEIDDPSAYSRLFLLDDNEFYGYVENSKFEKLIEKLKSNGIIDRK